MSELNVQAVGNKIIVKVLKPRLVETKGKIVLPENTQAAAKPQLYGEIMSIGEEVKEGIFEVGDTIVFHPNGGQDMVLENNVCKVLMYEEVYGIESRKVDKDEKTPENEFLTIFPEESSRIITPEFGGIKEGKV